MSEAEYWQDRYQRRDTPWETGRPSSELVRVIAEEGIAPCRALDLGCGSGTHALWLAQQGFQVVGVDVSPLAIDQARERARTAGVPATFLVADLLQLADLRPDFRFFFDRGCYHVLRRIDVRRYLQTIAAWTVPGARGLVLAGNAREKREPGPPVVTEEELRREWSEGGFEILKLRETRFDPSLQAPGQPLAWSALVRRAGMA